MTVFLITSLFALFLTFLDSRKIMAHGMKIGFFIITIVQAFRYGCGNDYMNYMRDFETLSFVSIFDVIRSMEDYGIEPGWALINIIFQPFGFYTLIAAVSVFESLVYYKCIKKYVDRSAWWFAVSIYLFFVTTGYLINMSMIRQGLAITIFILSFPIFKQGDILKSFIVVLLMASIHLSALVLFPVCLINYISKNLRIFALSLIAIIIVLFTSSIFLKDILSQIFAIQVLSNYEGYADTEEGKFGWGVLLKSIPFFITMYYFLRNEKINKKNNTLVLVSSFYYLFLPFSQIIDLAARAGYYFLGLNVFVYPLIYNKLSSGYRFFFVFYNVFFLVLDYIFFFSKSVYAPFYIEYSSIFSIII